MRAKPQFVCHAMWSVQNSRVIVFVRRCPPWRFNRRVCRVELRRFHHSEMGLWARDLASGSVITSSNCSTAASWPAIELVDQFRAHTDGCHSSACAPCPRIPDTKRKNGSGFSRIRSGYDLENYSVSRRALFCDYAFRASASFVRFFFNPVSNRSCAA